MKYNSDPLYQDRTWFDELGERIMQMLLARLPQDITRLWTTGFALFSALCVAWAAGLATHAVLYDLPGNQIAAQILAALMLLVAARHFLAATGRSAVQLRAKYKLVQRPVYVAPVVSNPQQQSPVDSASDKHQFFLQLRRAGVQLQVARALHAAGFTCAAQVRDAADARLLALPGVGRGTLRKLRVHFGFSKSSLAAHSKAS